jgi:hypothetical protein
MPTNCRRITTLFNAQLPSRPAAPRFRMFAQIYATAQQFTLTEPSTRSSNQTGARTTAALAQLLADMSSPLPISNPAMQQSLIANTLPWSESAVAHFISLFRTEDRRGVPGGLERGFGNRLWKREVLWTRFTMLLYGLGFRPSPLGHRSPLSFILCISHFTCLRDCLKIRLIF